MIGTRKLIAAAVASGLVLAACGGDDDDAGSSTEPQTSAEPAATEPAATDPAATEPAGTEPTGTEPAGTEPGTEPSGDPIVIGAVMPETGDFGFIGSEAIIGIEAAVRDLNASGGILGRPVELVNRDSGSDANQGILAVREIIDNSHPVFMLPDTISSIAQGTQPLTTEAKIPTSSAASAPDLGNAETFPYHFQAFVDITKQAEAVYAGLRLKGAEKVGVITSDDAAGVAVGDAAEADLPAFGFEVVGRERFSPGTTDLTVQVQRLQSAGADALFVHALGQDNGTIMQAMLDIGWDAVAIADASSLSGDLANIIPADAHDQFFTLTARAMLQGPGSEALHDMFSSIGEVNSLQVPAINYDIVMLAAWAIEQAGSTDPDAIKAAFESLEGTSDADLPELVYFPNPGWSPTVHSLNNADFTDFWGLVHVAPPVNGAYEGEPLTLIEP